MSLSTGMLTLFKVFQSPFIDQDYLMNQTFIRIEKPKRKLLDLEFIPTPLLADKERKPIKILPLESHKRPSGLMVIWRFLLFGLHVLGLRLRGVKDNTRLAKEARELFQGLGGLWIKLGQLLSLRTDFFSDEMCNELSNLLFANIGFPGADARLMIERELGCPLHRIFSEFDENPIAAASIAQVHRAVLRKENIPVVVKLLRPNVIQDFRRDMSLLRWIVNVLEFLMPVEHLRLHDGLNELDAVFEEELNYAIEASNSRLLRKSLLRHDVYVPYVFRDYCSERMLVMEEISGVLMGDAIAVNNADPERFQAWCTENGVDPKKVATHLFLSNMRQLLEDNLFHGDMHPGNIILLRNNRYALIDFGTIGTLDTNYLHIYLGMLKALNERQYENAAHLCLHLCSELPSNDIDKIRMELVKALKLWQARSEFKSLSYHERSINGSSKLIGRVFTEFRLQINWTALRMGRTWGTLDASLATFHPNMNHTRLFARYLKEATKRQEKNKLKVLRKSLTDFVETTKQYQVLMEPVLKRATISYKQKLNKFNLVMTTIMRYISIATIIAIIFVGHAFIDQHYFDMDGSFVGRLVDDFPLLEQEWFLILIAGMVLPVFLLRRLIKIVGSSYLR